MEHSIEIGPIRPPSEAASLLLRLTRNCPWNKCGFCKIYKKQQFSRRTVEEIKKDIDSFKSIADEILYESKKAGYGTIVDRDILMNVISRNPGMEDIYYQIGYWLSAGAKTAFLQDANSLILKTDELVDILNYLKSRFPHLERITTYARSKTVSGKSLDELKALKSAGLSRIHIGMETGSDKVLEIIHKGVTADEHIEAGRKAMQAGFDLSEYYMPGLGGKDLSEDNALGSARVLNAVNPTFIRIRTAVPIPGTPLFDMMKEGKWTPMNDEEKVLELRTFISNLDDNLTSKFISDHVINLLEDLEGNLPQAKKSMLDLIDRFLGMDKEDRENFIIGRRTGYFRTLSDYRPDKKITELKSQMADKFGSVDEAVAQITRKYI